MGTVDDLYAPNGVAIVDGNPLGFHKSSRVGATTKYMTGVWSFWKISNQREFLLADSNNEVDFP